MRSRVASHRWKWPVSPNRTDMPSGGRFTRTVSMSGWNGRPRHRCVDGSNTVIPPAALSAWASASSRHTADAPLPTTPISTGWLPAERSAHERGNPRNTAVRNRCVPSTARMVKRFAVIDGATFDSANTWTWSAASPASAVSSGVLAGMLMLLAERVLGMDPRWWMTRGVVGGDTWVSVWAARRAGVIGTHPENW